MSDNTPLKQHCIMIVDDIIDTVLLMKDWLEMHQFRAIGLSNSIRAVETAISEQPDLILLDVMMPEIDGLEVCRRLKANPATTHIPIILVSARNPSDARAEGMLAGASDYLTKPVNLHDLLTRIKTTLNTDPAQTFIDVQRQLEEVAHSALAILAMEMVWLFSFDAASNTLRSRALATTSGRRTESDFLSVVSGNDEMPPVLALNDVDNPLSLAFLTRRVETNIPIVHFREYPSSQSLYRAAEMLRLNYLTIIPVTAMGKAVGMMVLGTVQAHDLDSSRMRTAVAAMASQVAIALDYSRLILDLTSREQEMQSEQTFRQMILDTMSDGLVVIDADGIIRFVNQRLMRMTDYDREYWNGRHVGELFYPDDRPTIIAGLLHPSGATMKFDQRLITREGRILPVWMARSRAKLDSMKNHQVIVMSDMTEQKDRQDALERQTNRLEALNRASHVITSNLTLDETLQNILDAAMDVTEAQGASLFLVDSSNTQELVVVAATGTGADALLGVRVAVGQGIAGWVAREAESQLVTDIHRDPRFYSGVDKKTGLSTQSLIAAPLLMNNQVIGVVEVVNKLHGGRFSFDDVHLLESMAGTAAISITNARLYESLESRARALESAYSELKQADKAKDEFIQNVSHELRTPLITVLGYSGLMADETLGAVNDEQRDALNLIVAKSQHLASIVNDIVSAQNTERSFELAAVHLPETLQAVFDKYANRVEQAGLSLRMEVSPDLPIVAGDAEAIAEAFEKIFDNAVKFGAGGSVLDIHLTERDNTVAVSVRDYGIGIDPSEHVKIFQRFYQVDGSTTRRFGGVGLGLAIAKAIIKGHGGSIEVDSQLGQGATFTFALPKYSLVGKVAFTS